MCILVSECVGHHNQSKHFLYTQNPGPPKIHTYSTGLILFPLEFESRTLYTPTFSFRFTHTENT